MLLLQNSFTAGESSKNQSITSNLQILFTETQRQVKSDAGNRNGKEPPAKEKKKKEKESNGKDKVKLVISD